MGIDLSRLGPAAQRQVLQKLQQGGQSAPAAPSKMGNEKTQRVMPGGSVHTFDSQREARRYDELAILLAAGKIRDLRLQQAYTLQGGYISSEGEMKGPSHTRLTSLIRSPVEMVGGKWWRMQRDFGRISTS